MDINELRSWYTLLLIFVFIGIGWWAYSRDRKHDFDEAANLPLNEPESPAMPTNQQGGER
jgi:cytochrome c oxidase cbb3-type subunit 4